MKYMWYKIKPAKERSGEVALRSNDNQQKKPTFSAELSQMCDNSLGAFFLFRNRCNFAYFKLNRIASQSDSLH